MLPLLFHQRENFLDCISSMSRRTVARHCGISVDHVVKAIPLPSSAEHAGTTVIAPDSLTVAGLFSFVGSVHPCRTEKAMLSLQVAACTMGNFFELLRVSREWCEKYGTDPIIASEYLASLYKGIATADVKRVCSLPDGYDRLVDEQTPGGFNEQLVTKMRDAHFYSTFVEGMDTIMKQFQQSVEEEARALEEKYKRD